MLLLQTGNHREVVGPKVLTRCLVYMGLFVVGSCWERGYSQGEQIFIMGQCIGVSNRIRGQG